MAENRRAGVPKKPAVAPKGRESVSGSLDDDWSKLSQREKFIRTAREVGADETGEKLDEALRAIGRARKRPGS
jgi:hypothetical protein